MKHFLHLLTVVILCGIGLTAAAQSLILSVSPPTNGKVQISWYAMPSAKYSCFLLHRSRQDDTQLFGCVENAAIGVHTIWLQSDPNRPNDANLIVEEGDTIEVVEWAEDGGKIGVGSLLVPISPQKLFFPIITRSKSSSMQVFLPKIRR
jgi:hypothetical protein